MILINIGSNLESTNGNRLFNLNKTLELIELANIKIIKKKQNLYKWLSIQMD